MFMSDIEREGEVGEAVLMSSCTSTSRHHAVKTPFQEGFSDYIISKDLFKGCDPLFDSPPSPIDSDYFNIQELASTSLGYCAPALDGSNTFLYPPADDSHASAGIAIWRNQNPTQFMYPSMDFAGEPDRFQPLNSSHTYHLNPCIALTPSPPPPQQHRTCLLPGFARQANAYETTEQGMASTLMEDSQFVDPTALLSASPLIAAGHAPEAAGSAQQPVAPLAGGFRFHAMLNAPTAMLKQASDVPVTYLNKGQTYWLSIADTLAAAPLVPGRRFRTSVRISFDDDEQRKMPWVYWSRWKELKRARQAQQEGTALQAMEYVYTAWQATGYRSGTQVQLETASIDGFSVIWTSDTQGLPVARIAVRFNFLSTDFSHSKGVKGTPVRLCAKTSPVTSDASLTNPGSASEICYCLLKLFRDHGAKRKVSNDVAQIKKSMDKLRRRMSQAENDVRSSGIRRQGDHKSKYGEGKRPDKIQKPMRLRAESLSRCSVDDRGRDRTRLSDNLHKQLRALQDLHASVTPTSPLHLRGDSADDPDTHPLIFPSELSKDQPSNTNKGNQGLGTSGVYWSTGADSTLGVDILSSSSLESAKTGSEQGQNIEGRSSGDLLIDDSDHPVVIPRTARENDTSGSFEAIGVDRSYSTPPQSSKLATCFYVADQRKEEAESNTCYHYAVYVYQRSLKELNCNLGKKFGFDPTMICETLRVEENGHETEIDDDAVLNLKDGQVMVFQMEDRGLSGKREREIPVDSEANNVVGPAKGLIIRLSY